MNLNAQLAKQFRDFLSGNNYTGINLQQALEGVTFEEAQTRVFGLNSIAMLVFHINYYVAAVLKVAQGGPLDAHDKLSYDMPPLDAEQDWHALCAKIFRETSALAGLIEQMTDEQVMGDFTVAKYGTWVRNLTGLLEHSYYHTGQISIVKKLLRLGAAVS